MATHLEPGQYFDTFEAFMTVISERQQQFNEHFVIGKSSLRVKAANAKLKGSFQYNEELKYRHVILRCVLSVHDERKFRSTSNSKTKGQANRRSLRNGCPVHIKLRADKVVNKLQVVTADLQHNHILPGKKVKTESCDTVESVGSRAVTKTQRCLAKEMSFLQPQFQHGYTVSSSILASDGMEAADSTCNATNIHMNMSNLETGDCEGDNFESYISTLVTHKRKRTKINHKEDKAVHQHLKEECKNPMISTEETEEDPDLAFFKGILPTFKELTQKNKRFVQRQILEVIHAAIDGQEEEMMTVAEASCDYNSVMQEPSSSVAWLPLSSTLSMVKEHATSTENLEQDDNISDLSGHDDPLSEATVDTLAERLVEDLSGSHKETAASSKRQKQITDLSNVFKQEQQDALSDVPKLKKRPNKKRCFWCSRSTNDCKYTTTCNHCNCFVCPRHSQTIITCANCKVSSSKKDTGCVPHDVSYGVHSLSFDNGCNTAPQEPRENVTSPSETTASTTLPLVKQKPTLSGLQRGNTAYSGTSKETTARKRRRCFRCPSKLDNKYSTSCSHCSRTVCPRHCETDVLCFECNASACKN